MLSAGEIVRTNMDDGGGAGDERSHVAPVIPLFEASPSERHPARRQVARAAEPPVRPRLRALRADEDEPAAFGGAFAGRGDSDGVGMHGAVQDEVDPREAAEGLLLRKLRAKPLSVAEARLVLRGVSADEAAIEDILDDCLRRGYLNDGVLAELLVRAGVERRGLGRAALARTLAQRGIERAIVDEALAALPDDDAERALEYARTKARSMTSLDREVAIRRLAGQLARRGYTASALSAAAQAVDEAAKTSGVRFR